MAKRYIGETECNSLMFTPTPDVLGQFTGEATESMSNNDFAFGETGTVEVPLLNAPMFADNVASAQRNSRLFTLNNQLYLLVTNSSYIEIYTATLPNSFIPCARYGRATEESINTRYWCTITVSGNYAYFGVTGGNEQHSTASGKIFRFDGTSIVEHTPTALAAAHSIDLVATSTGLMYVVATFTTAPFLHVYSYDGTTLTEISNSSSISPAIPDTCLNSVARIHKWVSTGEYGVTPGEYYNISYFSTSDVPFCRIIFNPTDEASNYLQCAAERRITIPQIVVNDYTYVHSIYNVEYVFLQDVVSNGESIRSLDGIYAYAILIGGCMGYGIDLSRVYVDIAFGEWLELYAPLGRTGIGMVCVYDAQYITYKQKTYITLDACNLNYSETISNHVFLSSNINLLVDDSAQSMFGITIHSQPSYTYFTGKTIHGSCLFEYNNELYLLMCYSESGNSSNGEWRLFKCSLTHFENNRNLIKKFSDAPDMCGKVNSDIAINTQGTMDVYYSREV